MLAVPNRAVETMCPQAGSVSITSDAVMEINSEPRLAEPKKDDDALLPVVSIVSRDGPQSPHAEP